MVGAPMRLAPFGMIAKAWSHRTMVETGLKQRCEARPSSGPMGTPATSQARCGKRSNPDAGGDVCGRTLWCATW
eukprot:8597667-Pyramimonas_sp.AAC.1